MTRPTVLVSSPIHEDGLALLRESFNVVEQHHQYDKTDTVALHAALAAADAVITRSLPMTAALIGQSPRLRLIAKHGAGLNTIDVAAATRHGIVVTSTGGSNSLGVAEATVAMILAAIRRIPETHAMVLGGRFSERTKVRPFGGLSGRTIGLVGFGNIAGHVARICRQGFSNRVIAFDPAVSAQDMGRQGVEKAQRLDDLLPAADILSLHVPLVPATKHMIGARELALMKPSAILVNTARGGVVDEAALAAALESGTLAGAAVDVFEMEPPDLAAPLLKAPNIVFSPHVGGITEEALRQTAREAAAAVIAVLGGQKPAHLANPDIWPTRRGAPAQA